MKKIHYILYVCDNELFFLNIKTNKVIKEKFKSIKKEQIIDSDLFVNEFSDFLKKNHIKTTLFGENIIFIKNKNIEPIVLKKYEEILKDYFHKIEYKDLDEILKIEKDIGFLNITNKYIDYYFMRKSEKTNLRINLEIFNNNVNKTIHHIITNIYKPKKIIVFGNQENNSKIAEQINREYNIITTFPEEHYHYIFEECKK